jgi:hypothetical protein
VSRCGKKRCFSSAQKNISFSSSCATTVVNHDGCENGLVLFGERCTTHDGLDFVLLPPAVAAAHNAGISEVRVGVNFGKAKGVKM